MQGSSAFGCATLLLIVATSAAPLAQARTFDAGQATLDTSPDPFRGSDRALLMRKHKFPLCWQGCGGWCGKGKGRCRTGTGYINCCSKRRFASSQASPDLFKEDEPEDDDKAPPTEELRKEMFKPTPIASDDEDAIFLYDCLGESYSDYYGHDVQVYSESQTDGKDAGGSDKKTDGNKGGESKLTPLDDPKAAVFELSDDAKPARHARSLLSFRKKLKLRYRRKCPVRVVICNSHRKGQCLNTVSASKAEAE